MRNRSHHISKLLLITLLLLFSCNVPDTEEGYCDYQNCDTKEPFEATLNIKLTINPENPEVPVTIYRGKVEENMVVYKLKSKTENITAKVTIDNYYSISARYLKGKDTIIAINGSLVKKRSESVCDSLCWSIDGKNLDVRLK